VRSTYIILYRRLSSLIHSRADQTLRCSFHLTFIFLPPLLVPALGFNYMRCERVKINMVLGVTFCQAELHTLLLSLSPQKHSRLCLTPSYIKSTACSFLPRPNHDLIKHSCVVGDFVSSEKVINTLTATHKINFLAATRSNGWYIYRGKWMEEKRVLLILIS
jgi:hypothetical protein